MQHVEHSNRNIVSEIGRIRNRIWEGKQEIFLEQPIIWLILSYLFSYNRMVKIHIPYCRTNASNKVRLN